VSFMLLSIKLTTMSKDQKGPNLEQQQQLSQQQKNQQRGLDTEQSQPVFDPREEKPSASNQKDAGQQQKLGANPATNS